MLAGVVGRELCVAYGKLTQCMIKRFLVLKYSRNFLQRGKACVVPFGIFCRQFRKRAEDWRDPAGRRDQSKFNPGPVQVGGTKSLKHEVAFIRDQQFEFAASQLSYFVPYLCVMLFSFNKMLQLLWKNIGVCALYGSIRIRG